MQATQSPAAASLGPTLRACQSCATSKSRCMPPVDGTDGKCARCFKSQKDCIFPPKNPKKRKSPTSTAAELEEKIQSLAMLLATQQQALARSLPPIQNNQQQPRHEPNGREPGTSSANRHSLPSDEWTNDVPHLSNSKAPSGSMPFRENANRQSQSAQPTPSTIAPDTFEKDGEYLFKTFRGQFFRRFPFVAIPSNISARDFQAQRPWLFKATTIIASQDKRAQQFVLGKDLISDLAVAMVANGEKSLDMLQAMVIYNAWGFLISPQKSSTAHLQLAIAMVFDLGLNQTATAVDASSPELLTSTSKSFGVSSESTKVGMAHSIEERRTLLAVYFLTSMLSWSAKRIEGLQYSPYIEYCRCSLLEFAESESDIVLAALVKIQSILEKAHRKFLESSYPSGDAVPLWMHSQLATLELQNYWNTLSPDTQRNEILTANYYGAEVSLLEPCLSKSPFPRDLSGGNTNRLSMLQSCLTAVRKLLDYVLEQPISNYFTFCVTDIVALGYSCRLFFKLSLVEEMGWDLNQLRQTVPFKDYFMRVCTNFEKIGIAIDNNQNAPCRPSHFTVSTEKIKKVKAWYEARLTAGSQPANMPSQDFNQPLPFDNMGLFNDQFWNEFLVDRSFV